MITNHKSVFLQPFLFDNIQHGQANGAGNRVAAKGVEIFHSIVERRGYFRGGYDRCHRMTITNGFAHCDYIRNDALSFKTPEMRAHSTETDLNLICDTDAS